MPNGRGLAVNGRVGVHGNEEGEGESVCVRVRMPPALLSPPPDTVGKASNGGNGENELKGEKKWGAREKIIKRLSPDSFN